LLFLPGSLADASGVGHLGATQSLKLGSLGDERIRGEQMQRIAGSTKAAI
jgi:hypothetical protein